MALPRSPKTLRHTMSTLLASAADGLAGHPAQDTFARNYDHLSPDNLVAAIREVDTFVETPSEHMSAHAQNASDCATRRLIAKSVIL